MGFIIENLKKIDAFSSFYECKFVNSKLNWLVNTLSAIDNSFGVVK